MFRFWNFRVAYGSAGANGVRTVVPDSVGPLRVRLPARVTGLRRTGHHDSLVRRRVRLLHGGLRGIPCLHLLLGVHHRHQTLPTGHRLSRLRGIRRRGNFHHNMQNSLAKSSYEPSRFSSAHHVGGFVIKEPLRARRYIHRMNSILLHDNLSNSNVLV